MQTLCRIVMLLLFCAVGQQVIACSVHGTSAGNGLWLPTGQGGGMVQGVILLESTLVPPSSATTCVAAVGLGSTGNLAPAGLDVTGAAIVIVNTIDGSRTVFSPFSFSANPVTTSAFAAGSGSSSVPGTNPLFADSTWFGFSADVLPFSLPTLAPDEYLAMQFTVEVPEALVPLALDAQFGAGPGQTDGTPIFDGAHPVQYFAASDPELMFTAPIPEPAALALTMVAALSCVCARPSTLGFGQRD